MALADAKGSSYWNSYGMLLQGWMSALDGNSSAAVLHTSRPPRSGSPNLGEVDYDALIEKTPQDVGRNLQGNYTRDHTLALDPDAAF